MERKLRHLLLTTVEEPFDPNSWSGTPFSLRCALEQRVERVTVFKPGPPMRNPVDVVKRVLHGGSPPRYPLWMTHAALRKTAREVQAEIVRTQPDAVLSISSQCVAYLAAPGVPSFLFSDAPWLAWQQAYAAWETMPIPGLRYAEDEAQAARRLDGLCFGSAWACTEAFRLYSLEDRHKLHVTPLGANWTPSLPRDALFERVRERSFEGEIELLFVGRDWERKGGPLAVEIAQRMVACGRQATLHIAGCTPELPAAIAGEGGFVRLHGLLRLDVAAERAALTELFLRSHLLLVPTLAECYGVAFAEAQAFALPPVSRAVDALPSVIADGETGLLMAANATAADYTERMLALLNDREAYLRMAFAARARFEALLNWDRTADSIVEVIEQKLR
jgi:glycosyltransferase involved in cell wall biosynthesis